MSAVCQPTDMKMAAQSEVINVWTARCGVRPLGGEVKHEYEWYDPSLLGQGMGFTCWAHYYVWLGK